MPQPKRIFIIPKPRARKGLLKGFLLESADAVSYRVTRMPEGLPVTVARIVDGLKGQGIQPEAGRVPTLEAQPVVATPGSYTPKRLADKILAARSSIEG